MTQRRTAGGARSRSRFSTLPRVGQDPIADVNTPFEKVVHWPTSSVNRLGQLRGNFSGGTALRNAGWLSSNLQNANPVVQCYVESSLMSRRDRWTHGAHISRKLWWRSGASRRLVTFCHACTPGWPRSRNRLRNELIETAEFEGKDRWKRQIGT